MRAQKRRGSAGMARTGKVFLTTNKRQFTRRKFQECFAKSAYPRKSACGEKVFWGGAASCRSIFCYFFSRKLQALKARQNMGTRERREREFSHADSADCANFMGGYASRVSNFIFTPQTLLCRRH